MGIFDSIPNLNPVNNLDLVAVFALPFFIVNFPQIQHRVGYQFAIAIIASYCVGLSVLFYRCRQQTRSLDYSKSMKLLISVAAIFIIYVVLILVSPYLVVFPPARIFSTIMTSNLGAIITGVIGATIVAIIKSTGKTCVGE